jgi:hypothetical protein
VDLGRAAMESGDAVVPEPVEHIRCRCSPETA